MFASMQSMPEDRSVLAMSAQGDPEGVAAAVTRAGMRGDRDAVDALLVLLGHADGGVRSAAATALGLIGSDKALEALRAATLGDDEDLAQAATFALTRMGDPSAARDACGRLVVQLGDHDPEQRALAARALGALAACDCVPAVCEALRDPDDCVRIDAAAALGMIGDSRATEPLALAGFADPSEEVRLAAMQSLAHLVTSGMAAV
jgi:HEAT repeat protein